MEWIAGRGKKLSKGSQVSRGRKSSQIDKINPLQPPVAFFSAFALLFRPRFAAEIGGNAAENGGNAAEIGGNAEIRGDKKWSLIVVLAGCGTEKALLGLHPHILGSTVAKTDNIIMKLTCLGP